MKKCNNHKILNILFFSLILCCNQSWSTGVKPYSYSYFIYKITRSLAITPGSECYEKMTAPIQALNIKRSESLPVDTGEKVKSKSGYYLDSADTSTLFGIASLDVTLNGFGLLSIFDCNDLDFLTKLPEWEPYDGEKEIKSQLEDSPEGTPYISKIHRMPAYHPSITGLNKHILNQHWPDWFENFEPDQKYPTILEEAIWDHHNDGRNHYAIYMERSGLETLHLKTSIYAGYAHEVMKFGKCGISGLISIDDTRMFPRSLFLPYDILQGNIPEGVMPDVYCPFASLKRYTSVRQFHLKTYETDYISETGNAPVGTRQLKISAIAYDFIPPQPQAVTTGLNRYLQPRITYWIARSGLHKNKLLGRRILYPVITEDNKHSYKGIEYRFVKSRRHTR